MDDWYVISNVDRIDSPALAFYPDRISGNIELAKRIIGDTNRLRPHVKTNKAAEVSRMLLDAGIRKFKCATIAEAEMLGHINAPDVLLAYQPVGPEDFPLIRFDKGISRHPLLLLGRPSGECPCDLGLFARPGISPWMSLSI